MNPEETPFFRKELTGETHKAEGERVRVEGRRGVGKRRRRRKHKLEWVWLQVEMILSG